MLLSTHTFAQENNELKQPTEQLAPINVISNQEVGYEYSGLVTDERKIITSNKNLITNNHDLVHNSTDLGIPEIGRYGSQGFNIRGVEGNRVAIEVDGIEQEQSNIYPAYDFHNNSRVDIDTELMRTVDINKGGNPFSANSGLGGLVSYKTKNADDLLLDRHPVGVYLKNTYNGKYKQWINTAGGAFATRYVDGLMLYSHRQGHETQIERYDNGSHIGPERSLPNPYEQRQYNYLAKLGFNLNPENRIDLKLDKQHNKTNGYELTQESLPYNKIADLQERKSYTINYSYMPVNKWFNLAKIGFTHQQTLFEGNNTYGQIADNESNNVYSTKLNQINGQFNFSPITIYRSEHNFNISSLYNKHDFKTHRIRHRDNEYTEQQTPVKTNRFNLSFSDRMSFNNGISAYASLHYDPYITIAIRPIQKVNYKQHIYPF
ncbi:MAG: TonB-dependent receptor plug domain-containing protein [Pasteurellaceae bacterium]|nr:TonB-dependent receptor plug domain-containing protein [Pasteurellaceae bacterium]